MNEEFNEPQVTEEISAAQNTKDTEVIQEDNKAATEEPNNTQTETVKVEPETDYSAIQNEEQAAEVLKDKGFEYTDLQNEYETTGEISKETREKLAKVGISDEVIDSFIEGRNALIERTWDDIASAVGGRDTMQQIIEWSKQNLTAEEKAEYDSIHTPNAIKSILIALKARMNDKEGFLPQPITGSGGEVSVDYFTSMTEVEEAINDPKYSKDGKYREKVGRKIAASREAGVLDLK